MKKNLTAALIAAIGLSLNSCGFGTTGSGLTNAQTANALTSALATPSTGSIIGGVLSSLLQTKTTTNSIVGTWTYSSPKVVFESDNVLAQLGSTLASSRIESTLNNYLTQYGFSAGKSKITFNSDGTCSFGLKSKEATGTYTFNSNTGEMKITGALGVGAMTCHVSVNGNELYMLFDADKLLSLASNVTAASKSTSSLSSLLKNYSGLKLGWAMTK